MKSKRNRNPNGCGKLTASTGEPCRRPGCDGRQHPKARAGTATPQDARAQRIGQGGLLQLDPMAPIHNARIGLANARARGASASVVQTWADAVTEREQLAADMGINVTATPNLDDHNSSTRPSVRRAGSELQPLSLEASDDTMWVLRYVADPMCQIGDCEGCGGAAMLDSGAVEVDKATAECLLSASSNREWIYGCLDANELFDDKQEEKVWRETAAIVQAVQAAWPDLAEPSVPCPTCDGTELSDDALMAQREQLCADCHSRTWRRVNSLSH